MLWNSIFLVLPANGQIVWIRVLNVYGQIALAEWDNVLQNFTIQTTGVVVPLWMCARWKPQ